MQRDFRCALSRLDQVFESDRNKDIDFVTESGYLVVENMQVQLLKQFLYELQRLKVSCPVKILHPTLTQSSCQGD